MFSNNIKFDWCLVFLKMSYAGHEIHFIEPMGFGRKQRIIKIVKR